MEIGKFNRFVQDYKENQEFITVDWRKLKGDFYRERGALKPSTRPLWRLDFTEGLFRMRKKLTLNEDGNKKDEQTKNIPTDDEIKDISNVIDDAEVSEVQEDIPKGMSAF